MTTPRAWSCEGCDASGYQTTPGRPRRWCSDACRKSAKYGVTCQDCGHRSNGSGGLSEPSACGRCSQWTREAAILACDEFFSKHSYAPVLSGKKLGAHNQDRDTPVPGQGAATRLFGSWNEMLLAAGLPLNIDRRPETVTEIDRLYREEGWPMRRIAEHYGWTEKNVWYRLVRSGAHTPAPGSWQSAKTHCPQGHEYAGENLYVLNGGRHCRTCRDAAARRYRNRQAA